MKFESILTIPVYLLAILFFSCNDQPKEIEEIEKAIHIIDSMQATAGNDSLLTKRLNMLENGFKTAHNELVLSKSEEDTRATREKIHRLQMELNITLEQQKNKPVL